MLFRSQSDVIVNDGFLAELRFDGTRSKESHNIKQEWYSGLLYIAFEKGYKEGWAAFKYKEKFGEWPNNLSKRMALPSQSLRSYIRSRQIAYAKVKARLETTTNTGYPFHRS